MNFPSSCYCLFTQALMKDPVVDTDGNTFERHAIEKWLTQSSVSPITGNHMPMAELRPNKALKIVIDELELAGAIEGLRISQDRSSSHPSNSSLCTKNKDFSRYAEMQLNLSRAAFNAGMDRIGEETQLPIDVIGYIDSLHSQQRARLFSDDSIDNRPTFDTGLYGFRTTFDIERPTLDVSRISSNETLTAEVLELSSIKGRGVDEVCIFFSLYDFDCLLDGNRTRLSFQFFSVDNYLWNCLYLARNGLFKLLRP